MKVENNATEVGGTAHPEVITEESKAESGKKVIDYESLLAETDKRLKDIEEKIWVIEGQYLNESQNIGNIFKGWSEDRQNTRAG